ncbi:hypothetical protein PR003_g17506 [Phytophthora rubi]|uniref:Uncharacterized protein n=1 Tax=Phytophthora rubi TaxID=129364 RepID=A0A6A3KMY2_9STRA|nr:hypothetical protein PR002_g17445 [Phytophthora rubi]KAE9008362.1 hypothetical protein PR001_g16718 [Phytophthora rubi]KAE9321313.1 hypothetical protein PR003_g17506 [Phytophthora rubi]
MNLVGSLSASAAPKFSVAIPTAVVSLVFFRTASSWLPPPANTLSLVDERCTAQVTKQSYSAVHVVDP